MKNEQAIDNLYWMLLQVAFRAKHGLGKLAEEYNLTIVQLYTLGILSPGKAVPMHTLSCMLLCDASNVTGIVDRLLSQGYVVRQEKPEDRRIKMISLTVKGEKLRSRLIESLSEHHLSELQRLTVTQRAELKAMLAIILEPSINDRL